MRNILFLLGSGISFPSGLPKVDEITRSILFDEWIKRGEKYYNPNGEVDSDYETKVIKELLKYISVRYDCFKNLNYEDIYYVLDSLEKFRLFEDENFLFNYDYKSIKCHFNNSINKQNSFDFDNIIYQSKKYIQAIVSTLLKHNEPIEGLEVFKEINENDEIDYCYLFSLNHDLLIEKYFQQENISYETGFCDDDGDVLLFNSSRLTSLQSKFCLIKLHGSINWYTFPQKKSIIRESEYGIPKKSDLDQLKDKEGKSYHPNFKIPEILTGTNNKIFEYNDDIFFELRCFFFDKLDNSTDLFVSGYGWKDEGISQIIYNWLNKNEENKLFLLYKDVFSNTSIRDLDHYKKKNQMIECDTWLENFDYEHLKRLLYP